MEMEAGAHGGAPVAVAASPGRLQVVTGLLEAVVTPERREVEVTCIRPGLSRNGNYYSPELIRSLVPLFEGARAFADHQPPRDALPRSIRDLVGRYRNPRVDGSGALRAALKLVKSADWLLELIQESLAEGPELLGVSIDADGAVRPGTHEGRAVRIVESISRLNSCDIVTRASAGGRFERLLQADNQSWWDQFEPLNERAVDAQGAAVRSGVPFGRQQVLVTAPDDVHPPVQLGPTAAAAIAGGQIIGGGYALGRTDLTSMGTDAQGAVLPQQPGQGLSGAPESGEAMNRGVREATGAHSYTSIQETGTAGAHNQASAQETQLREAARLDRGLQELQAELERTRRLLECERTLARTLGPVALPAPVKGRLEKRFSGRVFEQQELDDAVAEERNVLAELTDAGMIRGMGYEKQVRVGLSELDRLQKAFDQLFDIYEGERVPELKGIREAYVHATGDAEVSGVSQPGRLLEADITTASFSYLLGTSMNKRLLKDYQAWPSEWQKFCTITPIKDFKQQDRIRLGNFGSLSTVPEDTAYTTLTVSDVRATYSPAKRGNLVAVTRETIVNDDLYAIKQIPGKLAVAAAFTLAEFVYGFLTSTTNIYDGNPLFTKGGAHNNSQVTTPGTPNTGVALSSANMQTGVTAMRRQTNVAGKPIGLKPRFLVVPPELEWQAMVITKSAGAPGVNYNDINPMLGYCEVIVTPQYSSATMWNLVADPRVIDTIEIGFVGGQVNPILFVQDQPLFGKSLTEWP